MIYDKKITEKSFNEMLKFVKFANETDEIPLLFGGWAVYQYNPYAGSKDVDLIVDDEKFDKCVDFLVSEGYELNELRLKKGDIFFDLYKKSEGIRTPDLEINFDILYQGAERSFLRRTSLEILLPTLSNLFLFKAHALIGRDVPKDQSDIIALLVKFSNNDFDEVRNKLDKKIKQKLELLINKKDIFSFVVKTTQKNIMDINLKLKKLLREN